MHYDDSEDASKDFGHALHDFIMLICGCTLLLSEATYFGCKEYWMYGGELDGVYGLSIDHFLN